MQVAVCAIGRLENSYIQEFVEYYKSINVDKIFLYDNNFDGEEHFEDVINQYIQDKYVEIIPYRNKERCQLTAYQDCYDTHKNDYDWFLFIDCDEYLHMTGFTDIKAFLSQPQFGIYDAIHINEMNIGDNGKIQKTSEPLSVRFPNPIIPLDYIKTYNFPENDHVKTILRGRLPQIEWKSTPHTPSNSISCCNARGNECDSVSSFIHPFDFTAAYFKHYITKTIEEYIDIKAKRGYPDDNKDYFKMNNPINDFFTINAITDEKLKYVESRGLHYDDNLDIFIASHKVFSPIVKNPQYKIVYSSNIINPNTNLLSYYCDCNLPVKDLFYSEIAMFMELPNIVKLKEYIGTCHYRRYFLFKDNIPDMHKIFHEYDAIAAKPLTLLTNVREQYGEFHNIDDLNIAQDIIHEKMPQYMNAFNAVMESNILFPYNMFIMRRQDFLEYIEFIRTILNEYLKRIKYDVSSHILANMKQYIKDFYPNNQIWYQYRIGGYLAERLTNVYFLYKFKRIKTYNVIISENKY